MKFDDEFHNAINYSDCRKWDKWINNNEKPLPCACRIRVQDCIFIETYYELNNAFDLYNQQQYFMEIILKYQSIKNNQTKLNVFTTNINALRFDLSFDSKIIISLNTEPYEKIVLQLNEKEFEGIIEFQELLSNTIIT